MTTKDGEILYSFEDILVELANNGVKQRHKSIVTAFVRRCGVPKVKVEGSREFYFTQKEVDRMVRYFILLKKRKMLHGMLKAVQQEMNELNTKI